MTASHRQDGRIVGYVPGAWDMFHIGHLNILNQAHQHCDILVVGVVTDEQVMRAKNKQPVIPLAERLELVAAIGIVDEVIIDHGDKVSVHHRRPFDVLFKGDDWKGTPKGDQLERDMASVGSEVHYFPYTGHTSSTLLRDFISRT